MTTNDFIDAVKRIGYKVNQSNKNVTRRKHKIQITREGQRHPIAWVFTNERDSLIEEVEKMREELMAHVQCNDELGRVNK